MRLMMAGIQKFGMHGADGAADRLQAILGRPLRKYADFVKEAVAAYVGGAVAAFPAANRNHSGDEWNECQYLR